MAGMTERTSKASAKSGRYQPQPGAIDIRAYTGFIHGTWRARWHARRASRVVGAPIARTPASQPALSTAFKESKRRISAGFFNLHDTARNRTAVNRF